MASNFPASLDSLTNPAGTQTLDSPDHAAQHANANDIIEAIESNLGTNSGTSVFKHFVAGNFPVRVTGVAATGTLQQTVVGGTYNNSTIGTPAVTGGTTISGVINNPTIGTPAITNGTATNTTLTTPTFSAGAVSTAAIAANAVTNGTLLWNAAPSAAGTVTSAGGWVSLNQTGTLAVTAISNILVTSSLNLSNNAAEQLGRYRVIGTSGAGTFFIPGADGFMHRFTAANHHHTISWNGYQTAIAVGTYVCVPQGSTSGGSLIITTTDNQLTASAIILTR